MKEERILITGGLGFIGSEIAKVLVANGQQVRLLDNLSSQIHGALPDRKWPPFLLDGSVEILRADVCDSSMWGSALQDVHAVVHLAAETGTGQSMYQILRYTHTNVEGTASLLDFLANRKHAVRKIILASSRSVYGEGAYICHTCGLVAPRMRTDSELSAARWEPACPHCRQTITVAPTSECLAPSPASIYAATKLAQEDLVRIASQALGIGAVILRFQNVYGEGQSLKNPYTGILSIFANQLRLGCALNIYEDGRESRDFVHVSDVAHAIALTLESDRADGQTLNVGSGRPITISQIASMLRDRIPCAAEPFISGHYRVGDIRHGFADLSLIQERLGFTPQVWLDEGLDRFVRWVITQSPEPDRLSEATRALALRGLMNHDVPAQTAAV